MSSFVRRLNYIRWETAATVMDHFWGTPTRTILGTSDFARNSKIVKMQCSNVSMMVLSGRKFRLAIVFPTGRFWEPLQRVTGIADPVLVPNPDNGRKFVLLKANAFPR